MKNEELKQAIEVKQICEVCDEEGPFKLGPILIIGMPRAHERPVGQCPTCERFFCAKHAEGISDEMNQEELREFGNVAKESGRKPRLLCCPLDLGVSLGRPGVQRTVIVGEVEKLDDNSGVEEEAKPVGTVNEEKEPNRFRKLVSRLKALVRGDIRS